MKVVDSHAHLDLLKHPAQAVRRARDAGVAQIITIGIDLDSSIRAAQMSREIGGVFCTVGQHPNSAAHMERSIWSEFKRLALTAPAVAIGECGLDYFRDRAPKSAQREAFAHQIEIASDLGLPLVIHDREAHDDTLAMLKEQNAERIGGVVHCFSGDLEFAKKVLDIGFHIGLTGVLTYPKNQELRDLVKVVPLERLLIETDCPFLAPQPVRGQKNEPAYVIHVLNELAACLKIAPEDAAAATADATRRLFGLPELGE